MALTINPATLNTELNNLNNALNNVIKPATINEHNLSLNDLNNELKTTHYNGKDNNAQQ